MRSRTERQTLIPTEGVDRIILDMVAEKGIVSIAELTERMHVSHAISAVIYKTGAARRGNQVSGGASPTRVAHEPSHQIKTELATPQKRQLAETGRQLWCGEAVSTLMQVLPRAGSRRGQLVTMNKLTVR